MSRLLTIALTAILILTTPTPAQAPLLPPAPWEPRPMPREIQDPRVDLLARLIHAEARGESFTGQVAVAAVVMNRVRDPRWPNTVREVIHQRGQFAPLSRGAGGHGQES